MNSSKIELNKITKDKFGRISGVIALNKPAGITSHDLVNEVRKKVGIRRVGHCGALDPFATGLMIILVGKSTSLSVEFLNYDKEYEFDIILGVATDTGDPDGKLISVQKVNKLPETEIKKVLDSFLQVSCQSTPIFSSARVNGMRLRELARNSKRFSIKDGFVSFEFDTENSYYKRLSLKGKIMTNSLRLKIPSREAKIYDIRLLRSGTINGRNIKVIKESLEFPLLKVSVKVSKGVYVRQLAVDIGKKLGDIPAMLYSLSRTAIGDIKLEDTSDVKDIKV